MNTPFVPLCKFRTMTTYSTPQKKKLIKRAAHSPINIRHVIKLTKIKSLSMKTKKSLFIKKKKKKSQTPNFLLITIPLLQNFITIS